MNALSLASQPEDLAAQAVEIQCPFPNSPESFPSARQEKKPRAHSPHQPKQEVDSKQTNLCEAAALPNPLRGRCHEHLSSASWRPCSSAAGGSEAGEARLARPTTQKRSAVDSVCSLLLPRKVSNLRSWPRSRKVRPPLGKPPSLPEKESHTRISLLACEFCSVLAPKFRSTTASNGHVRSFLVTQHIETGVVKTAFNHEELITHSRIDAVTIATHAF